MRVYEEAEYANERLTGTVVRCKGKAVQVKSVKTYGNGIKAEYFELSTMEDGMAYLKELDITPVTLGYANYDGTSYYLARKPMRQDWKQGLRPKNMIAPGTRMNSFDWCWGKPLAQVIENDYPHIQDVFKLMRSDNGGIQKMAFCRDFALCKDDRKIWYKNWKPVASFNLDGRYTILPEFDWIEESLNESMEQ